MSLAPHLQSPRMPSNGVCPMYRYMKSPRMEWVCVCEPPSLQSTVISAVLSDWVIEADHQIWKTLMIF